MAFDGHANFAIGQVSVAPVPALTGLSLTVGAGQGGLFPAVPFNCTVWPTGVNPLSTNAEIVRVTNVTGDVLTIVRAQEGSTGRAIIVGDQIANTTSVKVFTDIETATIHAFSAGAASSTFQTLSFLDTNGVSFSNNAGAIQASVQTNYLTTAMASDAGSRFVNTSAGLNLTNISATFDSNSISLSVAAAAGQSTQPVAASASNGSFLFSTVGFSNANNVTFGTSAGSIITASVAAQSTQPVAASASNGSFTFATLGFSNANNVTFGTSAGSIITASVATAAAGNSVNFSAGGASANLASVVFSDSNGVSFGLSGSTITASYSQSTFSQSVQPVAASASNGSFNFSTLNFSNANGVTFGTSAGSIISASINTGAFTQATVSGYLPPWAWSQMATNSSLGQNTLYFMPFDLDHHLYASRINFYVSLQGSIAASNATGTCYAAIGFGIYTRNQTGGADSQTLNLLTSYSTYIASQSHSSNTQYKATHYIGLNGASDISTSQIGLTTSNATTYQSQLINGLRVVALPMFSSIMTPGRYYLGFSNSTISGNAMTNAMSIGITSLAIQPAVAPWGVSSLATGASTNLRRMQGWGSFSTTTAAWPATIAFTNSDIAQGASGTLLHFDIMGYATSTNIV